MTVYLELVARNKMVQEASQPEPDLRLLVGHYNLLERLREELWWYGATLEKDEVSEDEEVCLERFKNEQTLFDIANEDGDVPWGDYLDFPDSGGTGDGQCENGQQSGASQYINMNQRETERNAENEYGDMCGHELETIDGVIPGAVDHQNSLTRAASHTEALRTQRKDSEDEHRSVSRYIDNFAQELHHLLLRRGDNWE